MDSQWLNKQFEDNPNRTKSGLAKKLGLEAPAVSKMLKGTRQIKAQEYLIMREYFGLPNDGERSAGNGGSSYILKPLETEKGLKDMAESEEEWVIPASLINQRTSAAPDKIKVFQIRENTMEPDFRYGEHVMVDLSDKTPTPPGVFVVSDGFGTLIRHCEFIPSSKPPEIKLSANNDKFQPQILRLSEFKILGRVIAKLQWV